MFSYIRWESMFDSKMHFPTTIHPTTMNHPPTTTESLSKSSAQGFRPRNGTSDQLNPAPSVERATADDVTRKKRLRLSDWLPASQLDICQSEWYGTKELTRQYYKAVKGSGDSLDGVQKHMKQRISSKSHAESADLEQQSRQPAGTYLSPAPEVRTFERVPPESVFPPAHTTSGTASLIHMEYQSRISASTSTPSSTRTRSVSSEDLATEKKEPGLTRDMSLASSDESYEVVPYKCW